MSGSTETKKPEPAQPIQIAQPAPVEPNPAIDVIASSQSTDDPSQPSAAVTEEQTAAGSKTALTARPKKAAAAKADAPKKKLTADDLINDN